MLKRPVFTFLTDVNVPDSVGNFLMSKGHDVVRVRDVMAIDSADPVVAQAAMEAKRILISWDKDFNHQRFLAPRFTELSRVGFSCPEPEGATRLAAVEDLFAFAIKRAKGKPVTVRIGQSTREVLTDPPPWPIGPDAPPAPAEEVTEPDLDPHEAGKRGCLIRRYQHGRVDRANLVARNLIRCAIVVEALCETGLGFCRLWQWRRAS